MQTLFSTRRYLITGSQRSSNYLWASLISLGGAGFLGTGFISFLERASFSPLTRIDCQTGNDILANSQLNTFCQSDLLIKAKTIAFFPQGLIMCFYGSLGLLFGLYLWCTIFWKVGNGFNEFNKDSGVVRIFRWGLPGSNRRIDLRYNIKDIESLRVQLKEGVNPRRTVSLQVKGGGEVPLTPVGQPISLEDIESEASELAQFLEVGLETLR